MHTKTEIGILQEGEIMALKGACAGWVVVSSLGTHQEPRWYLMNKALGSENKDLENTQNLCPGHFSHEGK